jgi:hypothetical protein
MARWFLPYRKKLKMDEELIQKDKEKKQKKQE